MTENPQDEKSSILEGLKRHPWITLIFIGCVILSIGLSLIFLPEAWSDTRKVAAGVIWGLFGALIITATKTVGKWDE